MSNISRRGILGASLAVAVAAAATAASLQILSDDTGRLQGMLDRGEPIIGGEWRVSRTLYVRDGSMIEGSVIRFTGADCVGIMSRSPHTHAIVRFCRFYIAA